MTDSNNAFFEEAMARANKRIKDKEEREKKKLIEAKRLFESERERMKPVIDQLSKEVVDITRYRNERSIMALPLFSTRCTKRSPRESQPFTKVVKTIKGTKTFTVTPEYLLGMPDEVDANILRFSISKGREIKYLTGYFPDYIEVTRYELCKALGLSPSGQNYQAIISRLDRLVSTRFRGNIFSFNEKDIFVGSLLTYRYINENTASAPIRIEFANSFRKHLEQDDSCLTIPEEIMRMQSSLQIRIVELVRLRMGKGDSWAIGLNKLKNECNVPSESRLKSFKLQLTRLRLPYKVSFSMEKKLIHQKVHFTKVADISIIEL